MDRPNGVLKAVDTAGKHDADASEKKMNSRRNSGVSEVRKCYGPDTVERCEVQTAMTGGAAREVSARCVERWGSDGSKARWRERKAGGRYVQLPPCVQTEPTSRGHGGTGSK